MNFTKEDALEKLKGILTNNGKKTLRMSETSVKKQLETLMPLVANDEMDLDTFIEKVKPSFEIMNSNSEKDNSDFIKTWEASHPSKKEEKKEKEEKSEEDDPMKAMMAQLKEIKAELEETKKEKSKNEKRKELSAAMEEKGIKDKEWRDQMLEEIAITDELDVDAKADSLLKLYNKSKSADYSDDYTPKSSKSGNKDKSSMFSDIEDEFKRKEEREKEVI